MIWELAGVVGVDPSNLTLRELLWMVDARRHDQWLHTSSLLSLIANVNRDRKKRPRPYSPREFNPLERHNAPVIKSSIRVLKDVFVRQPA